MQKRPPSSLIRKSELDLVYDPHVLEPDFPVTHMDSGMHIPDSNPLTYLHYHNNLEIGYCYEGSGVFIVDHKILPFSKGDASIIFENEMHIAKSNPGSPSKWHFVSLDPIKLMNTLDPQALIQFTGCLTGSPGFINILHPEENPGLVLVIHEILDEIGAGKPGFKPAAKGLILCMLVRLSRIIPQAGTAPGASGRSTLLHISPALDYVFGHYHQPLHIPDLADLCAMSVTNFRRSFTRVMGSSPLEYISQLRIKMAAVLLTSTDTPILDISIQVGYETLSSFNRHFKKIMGLAPREWRRQ